MRRLTYKLHGCALSTETKACVPLISMAFSMAVIAFRGKDKRSTEPCFRFARVLRLDVFPQLVQPATGERYASPIPSYQHFSAMGSDPIETSFIPIVKTPILINIGLVVKVDRILEFESLLQEK